MSFALLKKAFGIGKAIDDREFDEFLKAVDVNDVHVGQLSKLLRKKAVRLFVLKNEDSGVIFDSSVQKDPVKSTPTINIGRQQLNLSDMAFGSYSLNNRKLILNSMKIHDMSSIGQVLFTRVFHEFDEWRRLYSKSEHNHGIKQETSVGNSELLSLIIETLSNECAIAVCSNAKSYWGTHKLVPETHCTETIAKAFNNFLNYFRDLCLPKLSFPIWPTLNVTLSTDFDSLSPCSDRSRADCVAYWLNMDPTYSQSMIVDSNQASKDSLLDVFVRSCLAPLIIKGNSKEHRSFLARLITGILMFHTGWIDGSGSRSNPGVSCGNSSISNNQNVPVRLLDQLLTQTGFRTMGTDSVSFGSIFNCTVISGQSRAYLMALLHFATYFLRFMCLIHTQECLPELGPADLFELEQQKRRTRLGAKSRRKSGSATSSNSTGHGGDAHDSGISSQEDLTSTFHSASTGSSPTHVSGMALCMTHRLTRDQCRMAEVAAHFMVTREAAAAAAAAASGLINSQTSVGTTRSTDMSSGLVDGSSAASKPCPSNNSPRSYRSRYTEVPLLIEKFFDGDEELCSCLPIEVIPGSGNHPSALTLPLGRSSSPTSPCNTLDNFKTHCLPIYPQSADRSSKHLCSLQSRDHEVPFSSSSRVGDGSNVFSIDNMSPSSSVYHTEEEVPHTVNPVHHSPLPTLANHSLISGTVTDLYHSGHVLQATVEHPESFKSRLEENLLQWITYGPVIINDLNDLSFNNSNNNTRPEESLLSNQSHPPIKSSLLCQKSRDCQLKQLKWSATSLLINCDAKSIEAVTLIQSKSTDSISNKESDDANLKSSHHSTISAGSSSGTHVSRDRVKVKLDETEPFEQQSVPMTPQCKFGSCITRRIIPIKPAPLVFRLIEQIHMVLDSTNCSLMTLKHLEGNLQSIYLKSSILTNLLVKEGSNTLHRVDRMTVAAGCLPEDLPLLLSIASSCSAQVANILHSSHFDWLNL
ncbi:hypothetical protein Smp_149030 [Schistosoma mansoni]|uniref:hypothetical protein n=1 Tax=Schistosoma mansoni TaxID=6183 RepID=UPI0001A63941|nr:hypothetical protein Smp_149030 [Schistosoma mansoni]|eukprot:XP_018645644.1 hypothetical protein Smp_149030 [Schistosoma mansoni]